MSKDFHIWEGVYESFDEVPIIGDGFESDTWVSRSLEKIEEILKLSKENGSQLYGDSPLYIIAADLYAKNKRVKILDFAGGMGNSFVPLFSVLPDSKCIDFTVVEGEKNTIAASKVFFNDSRIKFLTKLPDDDNYDIVHISSSLQYIDTWQSLLKSLSSYEAKYFIFTDLPAGDIVNTYVSAQNYYESKIAHIFFKLADVVDVMKKNYYELIYQNNFQANILKVNKHYPQDNFEEKFRINYSKTLVFRR